MAGLFFGHPSGLISWIYLVKLKVYTYHLSRRLLVKEFQFVVDLGDAAEECGPGFRLYLLPLG
jgi:hypothetical protein